MFGLFFRNRFPHPLGLFLTLTSLCGKFRSLMSSINDTSTTQCPYFLAKVTNIKDIRIFITL